MKGSCWNTSENGLYFGTLSSVKGEFIAGSKLPKSGIPLFSALMFAQILLEEKKSTTFVCGSLISSPETLRSGFLCFLPAQRGLLQQCGYGSGCWFIALCQPCDIIGICVIWSVGLWAISWGLKEGSCEVCELASFSTGIQGFWLSAKYFVGVGV